MVEVERIEFRKLFPGRTSLFGLLYGLFIGFIFALLIFLILFFIGDFGLGLIDQNTKITDYLALSGLIFFATPLFFAVIMFIAALIYNIVSKMGGFLYLGLAQPEEGAKTENKVEKKEEKQNNK